MIKRNIYYPPYSNQTTRLLRVIHHSKSLSKNKHPPNQSTQSTNHNTTKHNKSSKNKISKNKPTKNSSKNKSFKYLLKHEAQIMAVLNSSAILIQQAWKKYKRNKQILSNNSISPINNTASNQIISVQSFHSDEQPKSSSDECNPTIKVRQETFEQVKFDCKQTFSGVKPQLILDDSVKQFCPKPKLQFVSSTVEFKIEKQSSKELQTFKYYSPIQTILKEWKIALHQNKLAKVIQIQNKCKQNGMSERTLEAVKKKVIQQYDKKISVIEKKSQQIINNWYQLTQFYQKLFEQKNKHFISFCNFPLSESQSQSNISAQNSKIQQLNSSVQQFSAQQQQNKFEKFKFRQSYNFEQQSNSKGNQSNLQQSIRKNNQLKHNDNQQFYQINIISPKYKKQTIKAQQKNQDNQLCQKIRLLRSNINLQQKSKQISENIFDNLITQICQNSFQSKTKLKIPNWIQYVKKNKKKQKCYKPIVADLDAINNWLLQISHFTLDYFQSTILSNLINPKQPTPNELMTIIKIGRAQYYLYTYQVLSQMVFKQFELVYIKKVALSFGVNPNQYELFYQLLYSFHRALYDSLNEALIEQLSDRKRWIKIPWDLKKKQLKIMFDHSKQCLQRSINKVSNWAEYGMFQLERNPDINLNQWIKFQQQKAGLVIREQVLQFLFLTQFDKAKLMVDLSDLVFNDLVMEINFQIK